MNHSKGTPRRLAILILSQDRNRDELHLLDASRISQWCADLGFPKGIRAFSPEQMRKLSATNLHYANGGSRAELLEKLKKERLKNCGCN